MANSFLNNGFVLLDGAMGTVLQRLGVKAGSIPELLNVTSPDTIIAIHKSYVDAGSRVVYANTFSANRFKLGGCGHNVGDIVRAGIKNARAAAGTAALIALDVGPLGRLLEPLGTLKFEDAYAAFAEIMDCAEGADLIVIETMSDLYEAKAALLAAKERSSLPVMVTMSFESNQRTYTGCTAQSAARTLTALGADAVGVNCSLGPEALVPVIRTIAENTCLPVVAKPNAGLPDPVTGAYDLCPSAFAEAMKKCIQAGATIVGGCCGTSVEYIRALRQALDNLPLPARTYRREFFLCTPTNPVFVDGVRIIGERINPTGKKRFQQALLENDLDYILRVGIEQLDAGAQILDVNVGFPGVDEKTMLPAVVKKLQSAVDLPLQLDSSDPEALEAGLRVYNGIASVNSVNGEKEKRGKILPIVKKYGACVVGLTLNAGGMPKTAEERVEIARDILNAAQNTGIPRENVCIDPLTLTVSAQPEQARQTLRALEVIKNELGLRTVLGVSNISFGMPGRPLINRTFLAQALAMGLDMPIMNPNVKEMVDVIAAHRVLCCEDEGSRDYISRIAGAPAEAPDASGSGMTLESAVMRGLDSAAASLAREALAAQSELSIVEERLIPALDAVGEQYEKGTMFLPQLLSAAQAAQAVFEVLRASMLKSGAAPIKKGRLALATVQGDIHDIGKNIVKTVLENYGYECIDLGRDVPPEDICRAVTENGLRLVGLSALMTTTLPAMEETIRQLHRLPEPPKVMVGGAVVTPEYAEKIGADVYSKDAREAVEAVRRLLKS